MKSGTGPLTAEPGEWTRISGHDDRMHKIAICAYPGTHDVKESVRRHIKYIDEAADRGAHLIVFPEISLQGYPPRVPGAVAEAMENAERVPDGPNVMAIVNHAKRRGIYVVFGVNEAGGQIGVIYNTAILAGPEGYIGRFRKCHLGLREQEFWCNGKDWPVFATALGKVGLMICYDLMWPEAARELMLRGADIIIAPKAWPKGEMYETHQLVLETARAIENCRWVISTNYVGELDGNLYPGDGRIIDPLGRVVATTGQNPGLTIEAVDVSGGLIAGLTAYYGPRLIRDRQSDTYRALRGEINPEIGSQD